MPDSLTPVERDLMRHTLGLTRSKEAYRNHFCADEGHADLPVILGLTARGLMRASHTINDGRDTIFVVTDAGRSALQEASNG